MASVGLFCAQHFLSDLLHFIVLVLKKSRRRPPGSGVWALLLEDTKRPSDMNWDLLALRSLCCSCSDHLREAGFPWV